MVAGGGSGGGQVGGGGGAGGYITGTTPIGAHPVSTTIQVGAGGAALTNTNTMGITGTSSFFGPPLTANGGGGSSDGAGGSGSGGSGIVIIAYPS